MKRLDWYIIRRFFFSFLLSMTLLILIIVFFDLSEKIDRFIEKKAPLSEIIFTYYVNFIPFFVNMFIALFVFISVVFVTSRMAMHQETIAIFTSGISFKRYLYPFLLVSIVIFIFSLYLQNFVLPPANKKRFDFEWKYVRRNKPSGSYNIHMQLSQNSFFTLETYSFPTNTGYLCHLLQLDFNEGLHKHLYAQTIVYDTTRGRWKLLNGYERKLTEKGEIIRTFVEKDTILPLQPKELHRDFENVDIMNFFELNKFIDKQRMRGSDTVSALLVEKHRRISFPFATIILTVLGVAIGSRKVRGGTGWHLGLGIALSFAYILIMQVVSSMGISGVIHPILAAWLPNIIFAMVAYLFTRWAQQ